MKSRLRFAAAGLALVACVVPAGAGVVNPDISLLGQPFVRWTNDPADPGRRRVVLDPGETEIVFDSALNPYARGWATLAIGDEGVELEEGYFTLQRGLPAGLQLKGGKYRAGFGRLNPTHPHTYPFAERFRVLAEYLPGEESLNETGLHLSEQVPLAGEASLDVSADLLQGDSYRAERPSSGAANDPLEGGLEDADRAAEPRPAWLGRAALFSMLGARSALELGASATQGTNNVAAATRTTVIGGDAKAKLWTGAESYLLLQGEVLHLARENAGWDGAAAAYTAEDVRATGGYIFADYAFSRRYDAGVSFETFAPAAGGPHPRALGVFAGLALMEETTSFRLAWERFDAGGDADPVDTVTLKVVFSMGPHKAHTF